MDFKTQELALLRKGLHDRLAFLNRIRAELLFGRDDAKDFYSQVEGEIVEIEHLLDKVGEFTRKAQKQEREDALQDEEEAVSTPENKDT
jgi:hypothetical protein